jgi:hypothetical protein
VMQARMGMERAALLLARRSHHCDHGGAGAVGMFVQLHDAEVRRSGLGLIDSPCD